MKVIDQSFQLLACTNMSIDGMRATINKLIEQAGRTCYKSEDKITAESADKFVKMIMRSGHESVIEHVSVTVKFITDRGVTHELVRHRLASYSQESTRYCNYGNKDIEFIRPVWADTWSATESMIWSAAMQSAEAFYKKLIQLGGSRPEEARTVLPNSLKTEIVMTANLREWRHVFKLRTSNAAHPQMRALMTGCLKMFQSLMPTIFDDIKGSE